MLNKMTIENAKYAEYRGEKISITATIDGVASTSLSTLNGSEGLLPFIENNGH